MIGMTISITGCTVLLAAPPGRGPGLARSLRAHGPAHILVADSVSRASELLDQADVLALDTAGGERVEALRAQARDRALPILELEFAADPGSITLVGGGPGALDLLTVRAVRVLTQADVVFADRLGPTEHLQLLAPQARIVDVGKQPGHHKITQSQIEQLMIAEARTGAHVVRLKGGDPFVFGRGYEEISAAAEAGIPVHVVPGLSSCITVPAAAGIPVTTRGITRLFTVISAHDPLEHNQLEHLAALGGTLVVLMGMGTLEHTVAGLQRHGLAPTTPCAIIESGTTGRQRTTRAELSSLASRARAARCANPAVIVIGEVAGLGQALTATAVRAVSAV